MVENTSGFNRQAPALQSWNRGVVEFDGPSSIAGRQANGKEQHVRLE